MDQFFTKISEFFKKMLSEDGGVSSKRVVGFGSFVLIAAAVIVNLCGGTIIATFIFEGLIILIMACFGMNTYLSGKALAAKSDVASDMVKSDSSKQSNDSAKDILTADKPQ